jgi:hypothetical protein
LIQPLGLGAKIALDIAQGLAEGQLSKGQRQELIYADKVLNFSITSVHSHSTAKSAQWHECDEFGEKACLGSLRFFACACKRP